MQFECSSFLFFLQDVPDELWELLELEKLNLSLNSLKVLPPQLALLSNLVVLNLWGNQVNTPDWSLGVKEPTEQPDLLKSYISHEAAGEAH